MLSRRNFLNGTLGAGAGIAMATSHAQVATAQPARRRIIVDSQVHLWKADSPERPWTPGLRPQLPEPFGYERLLSMMNEAGVDRVVIVPPGWEGNRNDYAAEAVAKHPDRFGIMGHFPLKEAQALALIPQWKQQLNMFGIRVSFRGPPALQFTDGTLDWLWPAAEKAGLAIMIFADEKPAIGRVAEKHPQLRLIIDHLGLSAEIAKSNKRAEAIAAAVALAKYPNVSIKLSNPPGYSFEPYPFRDMTPFIQRCFDAFGPQRCHWGTDVTNSFDKATYKQRVTHFTEELPFLSEEDKDWVMGRALIARLGWA